MIASLPVVVAPNFHLPDAPAGRLLLADGLGWRSPTDDERSVIVSQSVMPDQLSSLVLLFALPEHLRTSFWTMLEQAGTGGNFDAFASEVGRLLTFKQLPPPERAVFELVLNGAGGKVEPQGLWAVVNLGEDAVVVGVPGLRVRLEAGEGARLPEAVTADVLPPEGEMPDVLLLVRLPSRGPQA
jgi:hypothetical protein